MSTETDPRDTVRRKYYTSIEAAFRDLGLPIENVPLARKVAAAIPHDTIYIPTQTRAYVALRVAAEKRMSATILSGHAWVRSDLAPRLGDLVEDQGGWWAVLFPVRRVVSRGGARGGRGPELAAPVCGDCFVQLPATGVCDNCDQ